MPSEEFKRKLEDLAGKAKAEEERKSKADQEAKDKGNAFLQEFQDVVQHRIKPFLLDETAYFLDKNGFKLSLHTQTAGYSFSFSVENKNLCKVDFFADPQKLIIVVSHRLGNQSTISTMEYAIGQMTEDTI